MGNMQQKQEEMKNSLAGITVTASAEGVTIVGDAAKHIKDVSISAEYLAAERKEELEDLVLVAINDYMEKVAAVEAQASQSLINDMLPGMGGMFGL